MCNTAEPKLSILVTHYNYNNFLPSLLDNIREQSFKNDVEIVIIDDCSDVSPETIIHQPIYRDLNIVFNRNEKRLFTKDTRLKAVQTATSDYITFVDADDRFFGTSTIEKHVDEITREDADILHFCTVRRFRNSDRRPAILNWHNPFAERLNGDEIFRTYVENMCRAHTVWGKIFKKSLWMKCMDIAKILDVRRGHEDFFLISLLFFHAKSYLGSKEICYVQSIDAKRSNVAITRAPGNLATDYHMVNGLLQYFVANGKEMDMVEKFSVIVRGAMISNYNLLLESTPSHSPHEDDIQVDEILRKMSEHTDTETLLKIFLTCLIMGAECTTRSEMPGNNE